MNSSILISNFTCLTIKIYIYNQQNIQKKFKWIFKYSILNIQLTTLGKKLQHKNALDQSVSHFDT